MYYFLLALILPAFRPGKFLGSVLPPYLTSPIHFWPTKFMTLAGCKHTATCDRVTNVCFKGSGFLHTCFEAFLILIHMLILTSKLKGNKNWKHK